MGRDYNQQEFTETEIITFNHATLKKLTLFHIAVADKHKIGVTK